MGLGDEGGLVDWDGIEPRDQTLHVAFWSSCSAAPECLEEGEEERVGWVDEDEMVG